MLCFHYFRRYNMNIDRGPSALGLQHMAARAQEVRKQFSFSTDAAAADTGKKITSSGQNLPQTSDTSAQKAEHATGLERAIERLQLNAIKNPDAPGLQHALEVLQSNLLARTSAEPADTEPEVIDPGTEEISGNVTNPAIVDAGAEEAGDTEAQV
jgi:hypothetical protein